MCYCEDRWGYLQQRPLICSLSQVTITHTAATPRRDSTLTGHQGALETQQYADWPPVGPRNTTLHGPATRGR